MRMKILLLSTIMFLRESRSHYPLKDSHVLHISWSQVGRGGDDLEGKYYPNHKMHLLLFFLLFILYFFSASFFCRFFVAIGSGPKIVFSSSFVFFLKCYFIFFCYRWNWIDMRWLWLGQEITFQTSLILKLQNYKS